jgi:hypothetical protein
MSAALDAAYFEAKAEQCFRLARACTGTDVAEKLYELGAEFIAEALRRGGDPERLKRLLQSAGRQQ